MKNTGFIDLRLLSCHFLHQLRVLRQHLQYFLCTTGLGSIPSKYYLDFDCAADQMYQYINLSQVVFVYHVSGSYTIYQKHTYLHCQTQFQSLRTGWGLSSVICPSSSSMRASASGGAHSWSRSVAARIRFPEDTKALCYTPHILRSLLQYTEQHSCCDCYITHVSSLTN